MDPLWEPGLQTSGSPRIGTHKAIGASTIKSLYYLITMYVLYTNCIQSVEFVSGFQLSDVQKDSRLENSSSSKDPYPTSSEFSFSPRNGGANASSIMSQFGQTLSSIIPESLSNKTQNEIDAQRGMDEGERSLIIGIITTNIVIFIIGFFGNAIVILVIFKFTRTETVTDIYILNLAMADLMFTTGLIFLITTMFVEHWIFGNLMCKVSLDSSKVSSILLERFC